MNQTNPIIPTLNSPCVQCSRRDKNKNAYTCVVCAARADFTLATEGDTKAYRRYAAFEYADLGADIQRPEPAVVVHHDKPKKTHRAPEDEFYYEKYYPFYNEKLSKRYGKNFETMKEIMVFLYEKYQSQKYIAEQVLYVSTNLVFKMLGAFKIPKLTKKQAVILFFKKKMAGRSDGL